MKRTVLLDLDNGTNSQVKYCRAGDTIVFMQTPEKDFGTVMKEYDRLLIAYSIRTVLDAEFLLNVVNTIIDSYDGFEICVALRKFDVNFDVNYPELKSLIKSDLIKKCDYVKVYGIDIPAEKFARKAIWKILNQEEDFHSNALIPYTSFGENFRKFLMTPESVKLMESYLGKTTYDSIMLQEKDEKVPNVIYQCQIILVDDLFESLKDFEKKAEELKRILYSVESLDIVVIAASYNKNHIWLPEGGDMAILNWLGVSKVFVPDFELVTLNELPRKKFGNVDIETFKTF